MKIFVLEDNLEQQERMERVIRSIMKRNDWDFGLLEVYGKPAQMIDAMHERGSHQLFFLDIEIKEETQKGIDVGYQIRKRDPFAVIVFVTTHSEYMPLIFREHIMALDFIDKEQAPQDFERRIEQALEHVHSKVGVDLSEESFFYESLHSEIQLPFKDILYAETSSSPHKVILYTEQERFEFYGTLSKIVKQNKKLLQCHRSFAVNPANVARIDKEQRTAHFQNGGSCLISRTKLKPLLQAVRDLHK